MTGNNIKSLQAEAFRKTLERLAAQPEIGEAEFAGIVYEAISAHGISEEKFRDTFGLTASAVERWTQRKNLPQPFVRPKIASWILGLISAPATSPPA